MRRASLKDEGDGVEGGTERDGVEARAREKEREREKGGRIEGNRRKVSVQTSDGSSVVTEVVWHDDSQ